MCGVSPIGSPVRRLVAFSTAVASDEPSVAEPGQHRSDRWPRRCCGACRCRGQLRLDHSRIAGWNSVETFQTSGSTESRITRSKLRRQG
jgi:hypothetical protein